MSQTVKTYGFGGGLDTNSSALAVDPGAVISSLNYEPLAEGYGRMQGIERFDGRVAPSDASYSVLEFESGATAFVVGGTLTGETSGATSIILSVEDVTGAWDGTASGVLVITRIAGTYLSGEVLGGSTGGAAIAVNGAEEDSAPTVETSMARTALAQAYRRSLIGRVPGQGAVRGVAVHDGEVYAWRDKTGGATAGCYKATVSGWVEQPTLTRISFSAGSVEVLEGQVVNGASSGATATAFAVIQTGGSWGAGTATGFIDLTARTGTFTPAETLRVSTTPVATVGTQFASTIPPGGRDSAISHNFFGQRNQKRLYGVNGVGTGFELCPEGTVMINTGSVTDQPYRVFEINNHLGFVFPGGSIQFSGTGEPRSFQVLLGAGEIGFGTTVTDVVQANDTAVAIFGESKIAILQGRDAGDFALDTLTEDAGALPDTAQRVGKTVYVDARGLRDLSATQAFGNFKTGALSVLFEQYIRAKKRGGASIVGSFVSKEKSHYRMMYNDGTGLAVFMGSKTPQAMAFSWGDIRPYCFGMGEMSDGEGIFVGAEDGYVYRVDKGNTIDGSSLTAFLMTPFNHFGSAVQEDRYHKIVLELDSPPKTTIGVLAQFDYADGDKPDSRLMTFNVNGGGAAWDTANWNDFFWSAPMEGFAEAPVDGIGRNASFIIASTAHPAEEPHVLQAYHVYRSPRKFRR